VRDVPLILLGIIFAVWLVLFITKGRFLKHPFERTVSSLTGRKVQVGGDFQLYFAPLTIKFCAEQLVVSNPSWASRSNLFSADRIDSRIAPLSLLFGQRHAYWLDLTNGTADLEWNADHDLNSWSFGTSKGSGKPLELPRIDRATLRGTTVRYIDPKMPLLANLAIDPIASSEARIGRAVGLHGTGKVRGTPFRVEAQLRSPDATLKTGENRLSLRAWAANSVIDVAGTLPSLADYQDVPLQIDARGHDLSELLAIIGVAMPHTRTYAIAAQMVNSGNVYRFTDMKGRFGDSDLAGKLTITNGKRLRLDSSLTTRRLDIIDAAAVIGYNPDIVASKGAVAAAEASGAGPRRVMPRAALPVSTMQRFDANVDWRVGVVRSRNVPISNIHVAIALDRGRLALSPLTFSMARGDIASDVVLDTRQRPSADSFDMRLSPTPMGRLLAGYGVAESGTTGTLKGRIRLEGRGDTFHDALASSSGRIAMIMPNGTLWARNIQLSELDIGTFITKMFQGKLKEPVQINCGLIAFTVRDGIAAADPIVIDTQKNLILGRGGFSFRTEDVDLVIRAHGKRFSLFSAQSPVRLGGTFAKPTLDVISPQLLARAGVGAGLGLVATPIAAVLAFVDIGNAKAAACGPVLAGANAAAQHTTGGRKLGDVGNGSPPQDLNAPTKASAKSR
jgi:uncharacterized protein involved in outer membrane biogenesis